VFDHHISLRPVIPFILTACGGDGGTSPNAEPQLPAGVTIALLLSLAYQAPGSTQQFHTILRYADVLALINHTVRWSASDPSVATIDVGTGLTAAVAAGTATIMGVSGGKLSTANVTVGDGGATDDGRFVLIHPGTFLMGSANGQA